MTNVGVNTQLNLSVPYVCTAYIGYNIIVRNLGVARHLVPISSLKLLANQGHYLLITRVKLSAFDKCEVCSVLPSISPTDNIIMVAIRLQDVTNIQLPPLLQEHATLLRDVRQQRQRTPAPGTQTYWPDNAMSLCHSLTQSFFETCSLSISHPLLELCSNRNRTQVKLRSQIKL